MFTNIYEYIYRKISIGWQVLELNIKIEIKIWTLPQIYSEIFSTLFSLMIVICSCIIKCIRVYSDRFLRVATICMVYAHMCTCLYARCAFIKGVPVDRGPLIWWNNTNTHIGCVHDISRPMRFVYQVRFRCEDSENIKLLIYTYQMWYIFNKITKGWVTCKDVLDGRHGILCCEINVRYDVV